MSQQELSEATTGYTCSFLWGLLSFKGLRSYVKKVANPCHWTEWIQ